jgi:hypothetical protein
VNQRRGTAQHEASSLPAIPWNHESGDFGSVWRWETPHFIITVNGDRRSCYYTIEDKSTGMPRPFDDGQAATFEQAEMLLRGTLGKAYPANLGYQVYAGPLATTFTLGNGHPTNLGVYTNTDVRVTVLDEHSREQTLTGVASVDHYDLLLRTPEATYRISPSHIVAITANRATARQDTPTGPAGTRRAGRTYDGYLAPGCTGTPGFMAGTVDHTGPRCPVHEGP